MRRRVVAGWLGVGFVDFLKGHAVAANEAKYNRTARRLQTESLSSVEALSRRLARKQPIARSRFWSLRAILRSRIVIA